MDPLPLLDLDLLRRDLDLRTRDLDLLCALLDLLIRNRDRLELLLLTDLDLLLDLDDTRRLNLSLEKLLLGLLDLLLDLERRFLLLERRRDLLLDLRGLDLLLDLRRVRGLLSDRRFLLYNVSRLRDLFDFLSKLTTFSVLVSVFFDFPNLTFSA